MDDNPSTQRNTSYQDGQGSPKEETTTFLVNDQNKLPNGEKIAVAKFEEETIDLSANVEQVKFTSTFSTYMTLIGFSVGMSDFWRFPFLAYRNGGGAFLIPFIVMIVLCGFPLYFLEYSLSKFSGRGPYKIWDICPIFRGVGVTIVTAYSLWMIGTTVLRCWIVEFFINSFKETLPWTLCTNDWNTANCRDNQFSRNATFLSVANVTNNSITLPVVDGSGMTATEEFWQYRVLELSSGMSDLQPIQWRHMATLAIIRVVIFFGLIKSIKSIEKVIYVTATVPFFLTVAIFVRSLMLPGSSDGLFHFIHPDFAKITQPRVWIEATLMAFYTLGFGWGGNMLLGSHAHFKENCIRTSIVLPLTNMFMAAFSGLVCFSVLGNMAYSYNVKVDEVVNAGMSVGVVAYISALSALPYPQVWTAFFLVSIILTGIDGQLVPMDMLMQLIGDLFPRVKRGFRIHALIVVAVVFFLCSMPTCTGAGAYIFLWMDWYNGAWIGPIVAFLQLIVVAWIYGMDRFNADVNLMVGRNIPGVIRVSMAFVAPIIVLIIFLTSCIEYVAPSYGDYQYTSLARSLGWLSVGLVVTPICIQAVSQVRQGHGSLIKRLTRSLQPMNVWGPSEAAYAEEYAVMKAKFRHRTSWDLLYYNVFGSYQNTETENKQLKS